MLLDKVQRSTAELFCFRAAWNHFTVLVISNVVTEFFAETCCSVMTRQPIVFSRNKVKYFILRSDPNVVSQTMTPKCGKRR